MQRQFLGSKTESSQMIRAASTAVVRNHKSKKTTAQNAVEGDKSAQAMPLCAWKK
jgi:hypothetical protein